MNIDGLADGRKIPDEVMFYICIMAVHAVRVEGLSPELIATAYHFNRACIYLWLKQYDEGGYEALENRMPPVLFPASYKASIFGTIDNSTSPIIGVILSI